MNRVIIGLMIALCVVVGAGLFGILDSRATNVFLEATRPDFQKITIGVFGFQNGGGPEWLGGRIEEVLKADLQRSLVFSLVDLPAIGGKAREVSTTDKAIFKQAAENGVSVLVWGKSGQKNGSKDSELLMDGFVYDSIGFGSFVLDPDESPEVIARAAAMRSSVESVMWVQPRSCG